jgi:hypothetical protein
MPVRRAVGLAVVLCTQPRARTAAVVAHGHGSAAATRCAATVACLFCVHCFAGNDHCAQLC